MGQPLILPKWKFFDANGVVLAGGKLYSYAAGTTTPQATYTDTSEGTPNANPLILDANGEGVIWIGSLSYKFVLKDSLDNVLWTADGIQTIPNGSITTIKLADGSVTTIKLADGSVTTVKILDGNVTNAKIADGAVTGAKIPDGSIATAKLVGSTAIAFVDTSAPRNGDGPSAFPVKAWSAPVPIGAADIPPVGDGVCVRWSPNGKLLAVAENNTDFVAVYQRLGNELIKLSPGLLSAPSSTAIGLGWSPDGQYLTILYGTTVIFYQRTGGMYAKAYGFVTGARNAVAWSPNGNYVAFAQDAAPYVFVIKRTDVSPKYTIVKYTTTAGQSIPSAAATLVKYGTLISDNMSAVLTSGGTTWLFTAQREMGHRVQAQVSFAGSVNWAARDALTLAVYVNGSLSQTIDFQRIEATWSASGSSDKILLSGSAWLPLSFGDSVSIQVTQTNASAHTLDTDAGWCMVSIIEDQGFDQLSNFSNLSAPATTPTGAAKAVAWSPDGLFLAVGHATTPFVTIYQRTGDTFVKCTDPVSLPAGQVNGLSWSPDGLKLTCVHATTPFITSYYRTSVTSTTFTKIAVNPTTLPASTGNACAYNSLGTKLAVAHDTSPFITIYSVAGSGSSTTYTKDTDPVTLPTGNGKSVSWTPDAQYLSVGHVSSPYVTNYKTSGAYGSNAVTYVNEVDLV